MIHRSTTPSNRNLGRNVLISGLAFLVSWGCSGPSSSDEPNGDTGAVGDGNTDGDGDSDVPGDGDGDGDGDTAGDGDGDTSGDGDTAGDGDGDTAGDGDGGTAGDGDGDVPGDGDGDGDGGQSSSGGNQGSGGASSSGGAQGSGGTQGSGGATNSGGAAGSGGSQGSGGSGPACEEEQEYCGSSCIDLSSDVDNCGGCGETCEELPGAVALCHMGACDFACSRDMGDCDQDPINGCEEDLLSSVDHCGGCGDMCDDPPGAAALCNEGACEFTCYPELGDCDKDSVTGCEEDLLTSVTHCGACGETCQEPPGAAALCNKGECSFDCNPGFEDCDNEPTNGCEEDILSNTKHCGGCGQACEGQCDGGICVESLKVFVTSALYNGALGGLEGADDLCMKHAEMEGLSGTFKAWLGHKEITPSTRFTVSEDLPYVLVDGTKIADNWSDLVDGTLDHPINQTESGKAPPVSTICGGTAVWTSTTAAGELYPLSDMHCDGWTSSSAKGAAWGSTNATTANWSTHCNSQGSVCGSQAPLYCFQMAPEGKE